MDDSLQGEKTSVHVIVLMGVSGAGKTTVGERLASELDWAFYDADDLHPEENIAKMSAGEPLDDSDRAPWLDAVRELIGHVIEDERRAVVACSALKRTYRDRLVEQNEAAQLVYLKGDHQLLQKRLENREDHFMAAEMLASQFKSLEEPKPDEEVLTVSIANSPEKIVEEICQQLAPDPSPSAR